MDFSTSTTSLCKSTGIDQGEIGDESQRPRPRTVSIHILNDDSLLHVFYLYRPLFTDEDDSAKWRYKGRWWYALAHVCQRWRNILLSSATYLDLSLLCTYRTPVADMLAHSPPLPLVVSYFSKNRELTTEDEEGIILALKQHDRVRRVRLHNFGTVIQKLIAAMDEECPALEFLYIARPIEDTATILRFSESFQAPHLRYLSLGSFALPIASPVLTTAVGLVTLHLAMVHPSTYFHPNTLIRWISLMPQLETLTIILIFSIPNRDVEGQLTHTPIIAPITLPNLHHLRLRGVSAYLEALVYRITTPRLKELHIEFFNQLTFSVPCLPQFIIAAENIRLVKAVLKFGDKVVGVGVDSQEGNAFPFRIAVKCHHLDWQASSMAQISNSLRQIFSAVEHLILQRDVHSESSEEHSDVDHTEWRKLLRPFSNVKTLRISEGLVKDISRCLESEDGGPGLEVLPKLRLLEYSGSGDAYASFVDARRNAGHPVIPIRV